MRRGKPLSQEGKTKTVSPQKRTKLTKIQGTNNKKFSKYKIHDSQSFSEKQQYNNNKNNIIDGTTENNKIKSITKIYIMIPQTRTTIF